MRRAFTLSAGLLALAACAGPASTSSDAKAASPRYVIAHANVVDVKTGSVIPDQTIIIEGATIAWVGLSGEYEVRKGDEVHDARGAYAIPGLVEMHAHLLTHPWREDGELAAQYDWRASAELLGDLVKYGVTTVRDPGTSTEAGVKLRELVASGAVIGPEIRTAGRILTQSTFDSPYFAPVFTPDDVEREIDWQAATGVDFIKVYASMNSEMVAAAVAQSAKHGIPVIAHAQAVTWTEAARLGVSGVSHPAPWSIDYIPEAARAGMAGGILGRADWLDRLDIESETVREMIAEMASRNVYNDVTLIAMHTKFFGDDARWTAHPDLAETPSAFRAGWNAFSFTKDWTPEMYARAKASWPKMEAWVRALHEGGVMLTVGTDTPTPWIIPGVSMHDEMALLVKAGISPADVLRMATLNGAKALRLDERIGTLEAGKEADIVLLGADPTKDIAATRDIRLVIVNGAAMKLNASGAVR